MMKVIMDKPSDLCGRNVTVMGLGEHGGAVGNIKWLQAQGAKVVVTDLKTQDELRQSVRALGGLTGIKLVLGKHREEDFINADVVIRNPAVPRQSPFLRLAKESGVRVEMDSSLFFRWFDRKKIVGVTGSKGKSTTTHMIGALMDWETIGIEGTSPLACLDGNNQEESVVFELSSWRMEALASAKVSPGIAIITAIYRDHLNTYKDYDEYIQVKKALVEYQKDDDVAVLNWDNDIIREWGLRLPGQVWVYGTQDYGVRGIFIQNNQVLVRDNGKEEIIMAAKDLPTTDGQAQRNILPAILIAWRNGWSRELIKTKVQKLSLLPHRMERVGMTDNIEFINDSAATMPDATMAALCSLAGRRIIHILGGNDKKLDFSEWAEKEAMADIRQLLWLPGNASGKMAAAYAKAGGAAKQQTVKTMIEAVTLARSLAESGDVVLLSPGATSFGSYKNEFDRGNQFRAAAKSHII